jgi:hypothetical protein
MLRANQFIALNEIVGDGGLERLRDLTTGQVALRQRLGHAVSILVATSIIIVGLKRVGLP